MRLGNCQKNFGIRQHFLKKWGVGGARRRAKNSVGAAAPCGQNRDWRAGGRSAGGTKS